MPYPQVLCLLDVGCAHWPYMRCYSEAAFCTVLARDTVKPWQRRSSSLSVTTRISLASSCSAHGMPTPTSLVSAHLIDALLARELKHFGLDGLPL